MKSSNVKKFDGVIYSTRKEAVAAVLHSYITARFNTEAKVNGFIRDASRVPRALCNQVQRHEGFRMSLAEFQHAIKNYVYIDPDRSAFVKPVEESALSR